MKSSDKVLISALEILGRDIDSEDGVANSVIYEAANRLQELVTGIEEVLEENRNLADGDDCTLIKLKRLVRNQKKLNDLV
jgi:flagellar biosynthesis/type III secretory pathway chaperone